MISELQQKKFDRLFDVLDSDGSGALESSDLERLGRNLADGRGWRKGDANYEGLLASYQTMWQTMASFAQDGKVSREAFHKFQQAMIGMPGAYETTVKGLSDFVFAALDADGDGKIKIAEHKAFFRAYGIDERQSDEIFPKLDLDHDGCLTQMEVFELVSQFFFGTSPDSPGNLIFGKY